MGENPISWPSRHLVHLYFIFSLNHTTLWYWYIEVIGEFRAKLLQHKFIPHIITFKSCLAQIFKGRNLSFISLHLRNNLPFQRKHTFWEPKKGLSEKSVNWPFYFQTCLDFYSSMAQIYLILPSFAPIFLARPCLISC